MAGQWPSTPHSKHVSCAAWQLCASRAFDRPHRQLQQPLSLGYTVSQDPGPCTVVCQTPAPCAAVCQNPAPLQARNLFKRKMEAAARDVSELAQRVALASGWVCLAGKCIFVCLSLFVSLSLCLPSFCVQAASSSRSLPAHACTRGQSLQCPALWTRPSSVLALAPFGSIAFSHMLFQTRVVHLSWLCTCSEPGHMLAVGPDELLSKVTRYLEETVQVCVRL